MSDKPESIWIDRGPRGGWMFRTEKVHDSVCQYVPAGRIKELEAALQAKEDGLKVRDRRIADLEAAGWALFWYADHNHQCLVRRPNGINLPRCTCGFDEVRKDWKVAEKGDGE